MEIRNITVNLKTVPITGLTGQLKTVISIFKGKLVVFLIEFYYRIAWKWFSFKLFDINEIKIPDLFDFSLKRRFLRALRRSSLLLNGRIIGLTFLADSVVVEETFGSSSASLSFPSRTAPSSYSSSLNIENVALTSEN